ncbi:MAG: hypothetical protein RBR40_08380 [Tenuifilaceae bacterium]|nr:hypothetical protein [Tenuifilaceae bacterium]
MSFKKNDKEAMSLTVTEGLTVTILPSSDHEFLMPTKEVAKGYGASEYSIRMAKKRNHSELIEGKHFISNVTISHAASPGSSIGTLWTKRGIVRLGFFIKSQRARLFRDWAEDLIINRINQPVAQVDLFGEHARQLPKKRNHNRLSADRLVGILADVALVENQQLRERLIGKLLQKGGQA